MTIKETTTRKIDFELLYALSQDGKHGVEFDKLIAALEMQGIEMTNAVRELGVSIGILHK